MVKVNRPSSQSSGSDESTPAQQPATPPTSSAASSTDVVERKKGKQSGKNRRPAIGGTAVQGAKSTLPKELSTGTPSNQQPEYYNRETRRRMQQMGTGPYAERQPVDPRARRKKRLERLKERQAAIKKTVDTKGPSRDIRLGRRNTLFIIGLVVALVLLIVVFVIIRHLF